MDQYQLFDVHPLVHPDATLGSIDDRFRRFHRLNPWVYRELEEMTSQLAARGRKRVGIGMLFENLRYRAAMATIGDDEFRLNNSYRSRYARMLIEDHPEWAGLFETRALRTT